MANSTVRQSNWKPIVEPQRAKPKTYRQAPTSIQTNKQCMIKGKHIVGGIVFYKHIFEFVYFLVYF